jgi:hypothetical protein
MHGNHVLRKLKQDHELEASLGYIMRKEKGKKGKERNHY